jgi:two-component system cell cycle sensor histidine kinase/response regulator CckA
VAIKRDITERLQLERQVRKAEKLEGIGRLAGGIAHHFNNLLMVILGHSELLKSELPTHDPLSKRVNEISQAAKQAAILTKQLLAFGQRRIFMLRLLNLNKTIRDTEQMVQDLIGKDIVLAVRLDSFVGQVMADSNLMDEVIINLALNASAPMPNGGSLEIETMNVDLDEESATIHRDAESWAIRVNDGDRHWSRD